MKWVTLNLLNAAVFTAAFNKFSVTQFINVWSFTDFQGDDTRDCGDTIGPPDDEQRAARNMLRSVM